MHLFCRCSEKSILLAENEGLKEASRSLKELSQSRESEHSNTEKHAHHSLNQAAELTERQNLLISKLEDKVLYIPLPTSVCHFLHGISFLIFYLSFS